jgi:hypothetical protein
MKMVKSSNLLTGFCGGSTFLPLATTPNIEQHIGTFKPLKDDTLLHVKQQNGAFNLLTLQRKDNRQCHYRRWWRTQAGDPRNVTFQMHHYHLHFEGLHALQLHPPQLRNVQLKAGQLCHPPRHLTVALLKPLLSSQQDRPSKHPAYSYSKAFHPPLLSDKGLCHHQLSHITGIRGPRWKTGFMRGSILNNWQGNSLRGLNLEF